MLTDPDGVDDIIGGQLFDVDSSIAYGAFATSAQEGAYSITLTWSQLTQPRSDLPGDWNAPVTISLRGKFFDQAAHEASETLTVNLVCGDTDGTVAQVTKVGCSIGALCGAKVPPETGAEGGIDCYLTPDGASGADACNGWNAGSCGTCFERGSGAPLACNAAARTSFGALCTCN